jgi:hypothetical protein
MDASNPDRALTCFAPGVGFQPRYALSWTDTTLFPFTHRAPAILALLFSSLLAQGLTRGDQGWLNDNSSLVRGSHVTRARSRGTSAARQGRRPVRHPATAASNNASALAMDADSDDDGDDPSPAKHGASGMTLSASAKGLIRLEPRTFSKTTIFHDNLFSPFKSRPPP